MLLLYSGGLDTSVMLKWIQDALRGRGRHASPSTSASPARTRTSSTARRSELGARRVPSSSTRARSSPSDYVLPAIKANALYGGGYPLFTALGRPLIAKLAVEYAREHGCDTIAHGCTGKGNDQVRIEAHDRRRSTPS